MSCRTVLTEASRMQTRRKVEESVLRQRKVRSIAEQDPARTSNDEYFEAKSLAIEYA